MKYKLFLASGSHSRRSLLEQARIPFTRIDQNVDESQVDSSLPLKELVKEIALYKMKHVQISDDLKEDIIFVLTADSVVQNSKGEFYGKPLDREDAVKKIKAIRDSGFVATAFCLDKKQYIKGVWKTEKRIVKCVYASYVLDMPDDWIERYFDNVPHYRSIGGGVTVEGYGAQFLKSVNGSYTAALGLPMFELREALQELGFFS